jgi:NADPH-ferrihemoprotein reductase
MDAAVAGGGLPLTPVLAAILIVICALLLFLKSKQSVVSGKPAKGKGVSLVVDASCQEDSSKPTVRLLYGTQTGTAERFSKQLGNELRRRYGDSTVVEVVDIENYKASDRLHKETLVLYLMATYGDGEPTDNAADFYSWVCGEAESVENGEKEPFLEVRNGVAASSLKELLYCIMFPCSFPQCFHCLLRWNSQFNYWK